MVAQRTEDCPGGRIVHDNVRTEPTKVLSQAKGEVTRPLVTTPTATPELARSPATSSGLQCSEVTTSGDPLPSHLTSLPPAPGPRKSLSRELASLALASPAVPPREKKGRRSNSGSAPVPRRRGRSIDGLAVGEGGESDEENAGARVSGAGVAQQKLEAVEAKCEALSTKIRAMERKVVDRTELLSAEVRALRQTMGGTPARVLRSRNGDLGEVAVSPGSGTKRKRGEQDPRGAGGQQAKRERTTTWGGRSLRKVEKSVRVTRKSAAGPLVLPKGRRSLNVLSKK